MTSASGAAAFVPPRNRSVAGGECHDQRGPRERLQPASDETRAVAVARPVTPETKGSGAPLAWTPLPMSNGSREAVRSLASSMRLGRAGGIAERPVWAVRFGPSGRAGRRGVAGSLPAESKQGRSGLEDQHRHPTTNLADPGHERPELCPPGDGDGIGGPAGARAARTAPRATARLSGPPWQPLAGRLPQLGARHSGRGDGG